MTDTKTTGERLADQASEWALVLGEVSDGPIITSLYGTDISKQIRDVKDVLNRCSEALSTQDQQDTAMAWTLAEIRQIIGVDEKPTLDQLPDLVRAAVGNQSPNNENSVPETNYSEQELADNCIDFLEARADEWMADTEVQRMFNAIASVFEKYAPQEIMDRFRETMGRVGRQCHVEGALRVWEEISAQQRAAGTPLPKIPLPAQPKGDA